MAQTWQSFMGFANNLATEDAAHYYKEVSPEVTLNPTQEFNLEQSEFILCQPQYFNDVVDMVASFTSGKSLLVNLSLLTDNTAQRMTDYLCGAMLALAGKQIIISNQVMLYTTKLKISDRLSDQYYSNDNLVNELLAAV